MKTYEDLWLLRRNFIRQMACNSFLTYSLCVGHRHPQKMHISLKTGNVWNSELLPCKD